jgi:NitT/TauT family transport system permease protein
VLVWWAASATGYWDRVLLPSPASVWDALASNLGGPDGLIAVASRSVFRLFVGLTLAIAIGTPTGLAMAAWKLVQRSVGSLMVGLQALPSIAWLPLAILWFGLNERAILFVVIIAGIPAVAIAAASSVRLVPPLLVRAGRTLGAGGWELYRAVVLPAAVPGYVAGLQQAWALAWRALMAGELISTGAQGLGHLQDTYRQGFHADRVIAVMLVIIAVGMLVELAFSTADRRIRTRRGLLATA